MRKLLLSTWVIALLWGASNLAPAQAESPGDLKPLAVVGVVDCDELLGDLEHLAQIVGQPQLYTGPKALVNLFTQGKGVAGLDRERPSGAVIRLDGEKPSGFVFLPITDLDQLHDVFKPYLGEVTELDGGVQRIQGKNNETPAFIKEGKGGWLFVSDKAENLADTPADPGKLLAGLTERYDVAVRLFVSNVPDEHREKFIARLKRDAEKALRRGGDDDDDRAEHVAQKIVVEKLLHAAIRAAEEIDQVTLGWSLDREAQNVSFEASVTAVPGSKTAEQLAKLGRLKTDFGGFRLPGAAISGVCVAECPAGGRDRESLAKVFDAVRLEAFKEIDAKQGKQQWADAAKQLIDGLLDVTQQTIASGRVDGGMALMLKPEGVTFVAGRYIAGGEKLEETLGQLVEAVRKEHPDFVARVLKTDVAEHNGVSFHTLSLPIPKKVKDREKLVKVLGDPVLIGVGIGPNRVYVAVGKQVKEVLREAIGQSENVASQTVPPMQFSIDLSEVARFVAVVGEEKQRAVAQKVVEALKETDGKDHVNLSILPTDGGVKFRFEFEEGALKVIAATRK